MYIASLQCLDTAYNLWEPPGQECAVWPQHKQILEVVPVNPEQHVGKGMKHQDRPQILHLASTPFPEGAPWKANFHPKSGNPSSVDPISPPP